MRELLDTLCQRVASGREVIHCEVVETRGSTPQKPGSVMLVFADGSQAGTLGGGCTEAEVRRQALLLFGTTSPKLFTFTLDDNYGWDDGLICGGRMTFLAQPVQEGPVLSYFRTLSELVTSGAGGTEVIVIDDAKAGMPGGSRILFDANRRLLTSIGTKEISSSIEGEVAEVSSRPRPHTAMGLSYVPILPRCRLLIVGAGHVGQAVAELASRVDFDVWVLDDRGMYASQERFPMASRIWVDDIGQALRSFMPDGNTYVLIMTRGHSKDEEALLHLAGKPARYIGLIGSRRKIKLIFEDLEKEGISPQSLDRVYAPLGFDIGSQTVPEIALSIVSFLVGHRNRGADAFPPEPIR
ncbi:XdhC family protein [bacterium]|nr:XdhC family protein [bacterium]